MSEEVVQAVREQFFYPFSCKKLVEAHSRCLENNQWRECANVRDAMDSCIEDGERLRFHLNATCSRLKRKHQACLMQTDTPCTQALEDLHSCALAARMARPPPPTNEASL